MTIALGFRCQNGVVIASDSHYTQDISKTRGQKIFIIPTNGYYALTIGGAGGSNQIKWTVTEIQRSLADEVGHDPRRSWKYDRSSSPSCASRSSTMSMLRQSKNSDGSNSVYLSVSGRRRNARCCSRANGI